MESLWHVPKLISETVKRSNFVTTGRILRGFQFTQDQHLNLRIDWVHSRGSGIDRSSKTTIKILVLKFPWRSYHRRYGWDSYQDGPMSGVSPRPLSASNISEAAPVSESNYYICVPATVTAEQSFISGRTYCESKRSNLAPREWIKLFDSWQRSFCLRLIHAAFVTWRSSDSVLTWENNFN